MFWGSSRPLPIFPFTKLNLSWFPNSGPFRLYSLPPVLAWPMNYMISQIFPPFFRTKINKAK